MTLLFVVLVLAWVGECQSLFKSGSASNFNVTVPATSLDVVVFSSTGAASLYISTHLHFSWACPTDSSKSISVMITSSTGEKYQCKDLKGPINPLQNNYICQMEDSAFTSVFDSVSIRSSVDHTCASDFKVFRSQDCPTVGLVGAASNCTTCPFSPLEATCPGGNRIWPAGGYCAMDSSSIASKLSACTPSQACLGVGRAWEAALEPAPLVCAPEYAGPLSCCGACSGARGVKRVEDECVEIEEGWRNEGIIGTSALCAVLTVLGVAFYKGRAETIYFFPAILQTFRVMQAIALVSLTFVDVCRWGSLFRLEAVVFPPATGYLDYYYDPGDHPVKRLLAQLAFTAVFLAPLLVTPLAQLAKAVSGRLADDDVRPRVALERALITWFWLMLLPLGYIATGQLPCMRKLTGRKLDKEVKGLYMANYPAVPCSGSAFYAAGALSVVLLALLVAAVALLTRKVRRLSAPGAAVADVGEYLRYGFLYGALRPSCISSWVLDVQLVLAVVIERSVLGAVNTWARAVVPTLLLAGLLGYVAVVRPYRGFFGNLSRLMGLVAVIMAVWLRHVRTCSFSREFFIHDNTLNFLSITMLALFGSMIVVGALAAYSNREHAGVIRYGEGYGRMDDDGSAPSAAELSVITSPSKTPRSSKKEKTSREKTLGELEEEQQGEMTPGGPVAKPVEAADDLELQG